MDYKRITIICGHYGSGKTNVAINLAEEIRKAGKKTVIADLDIVNPYFRTKDSEKELEEAGIRLISSPYAGSNVDLPALPQEIYAVTDDRTAYAVLDVGGDERGALALGRLAPLIKDEGDFDMWMVINCYRPLTPDAASTLEVMKEIEEAAGLPFTGIINNSNLCEDTTPETVKASAQYAKEFQALTGLPLVLTTVSEEIAGQMKDMPDIMPIHLQAKPYNM